ncbi:RNA-directed DNA polymerase [Escherichia coli]|nr:RNA-directed DNA polymerase [Escherichia coli]
MTLLWKTIKAGHIDVGLFRAASEGVPQGGVISPLLSNIMLNEFDQYLHERYLSGKARKDRWYWNNSIQRGPKYGGQRKLAVETRGGVLPLCR